MLDMRILVANMTDSSFQAIGKISRISLKVKPTIFELVLALSIDTLPIIVNYQAGNVYVIRSQFVERLEDLAIRQSLAERVPRA